MKNQLKPMILAGLSLFMFSCSSDDSSPKDPPVIEKTYHLRKIEQNYYGEPDTKKTEAGQPKIATLIYDFSYDSDFNLDYITNTTHYYENGNSAQSNTSKFKHILNQEQKLQQLEFENKGVTTSTYSYTYNKDLLTSTKFDLGNRGEFICNYSYNDNKQLTASNSEEANLHIEYFYNQTAQLNKFRISGRNITVTYDGKLSPFYNLPYDLTSTIMGFDLAFPYTYKFASNFTSIALGGDANPIEYTYNEANLPTKAIYYVKNKESNSIIFDITYSYEIKETVIKP